MAATIASERAARAEALLERVEALSDRQSRETATEAVGSLVDLYGEALGRVIELGGPELAAKLADDELVGHLLLVHDLHPVPLAERVNSALAGVRPYLESHGGGVELLAIDGATVRLRLRGSCSGCPSSTMTLKLAIEDAIRKLAPDIESIEAEGAEAPSGAPAPQLLQIENAGGSGNGNPGAVSWTAVGELPQLRDGGTLVRQVGGRSLLFVGVEADRYAYAPVCPACGASLEGAELRGAELACPECARSYDVRRAGRCLDSPQLHLDPVPLLVGDSGVARVARAGGAGS